MNKLTNLESQIGYFSIVLYSFLLIIGLSHAQKCSSPDIRDVEFDFGYDNPDKISVNSPNEIRQFLMENTVQIINTENVGFVKNYIDAKLDANTLTIFKTEHFVHYEEEQSDNQIILKITLKCSSGSRELDFRQEFMELNNYDPEFAQNVYELTVPLPLPKSFDLTFYQEISARDIDLRNNRVTFTSPDSKFIDVGTSNRIGPDNKTFYATLITNQQLITIDDKIQFTIIGTDSGTPPRHGQATIIIKGDPISTFVPMPEFEKVLYKGTVNLDRKLIINEVIKLNQSTYADEITFYLTGDDSSLFSITNVGNLIDVKFARDITIDDLNEKSYLTTSINAQRPEVNVAAAVILIDIEQPEIQPTLPMPKFQKSLYKGSINDAFLLNIEDIQLISETFTNGIVFSIAEDDSGLFTVIQNGNSLKVNLKNELTEDIIKDKMYLACKIVANNSNSESTDTNVLIDLPKIMEPDCPTTTTPQPQTCPPIETCPTSTTPLPISDLTPRFENKFYNFFINNDGSENIGQVKATIDTIQPIQIRYELYICDTYLLTKLSIDSKTGEIFANGEMKPGQYTFDVLAKNNVNEKQACTTIFLTVFEYPTGNSTVSNALIVKYLKENEFHRNILSSETTNECYYEIVKMNPNDKSYFYIDPTTKSLNSISFDREAVIFESMEVPQIQLTLQLKCPQTALQAERNYRQHGNRQQRSIEPQAHDGRYYVLSNDIPYAQDITMLSVLIEDVNDNAPEFIYPENTFIGYPDGDVAKQVLQPNVVRVRAIDRDAGLNAQIKYSLEANDRFTISSTDGVIYPTTLGINGLDEFDLKIIATDRNGDPNGLSSSITLKIIQLRSQHLRVIVASADESQSIDDVIVKIKQDANIDLQILQAAIVPSDIANSETLSRRRRSTKSTAMVAIKMIVYAFNTDHQPLNTADIQQKLDHVSESLLIASTSYDDSMKLQQTAVDNAPIMAHLILIDANNLSQTNLQNDGMLKPEMTTPPMMVQPLQPFPSAPPPPPTLSPHVAVSRFNIEKRDSGILNETDKDNDKYDRPLKIVIRNESCNSMSSPLPSSMSSSSALAKDNRKSQTVTFNEYVERIDIQTRTPRHSGDDDDDVHL